ncbi:unnamed protein product [Heterobilharzia americana]|nr:unnamed protein product [Heterobilharzia americana]
MSNSKDSDSSIYSCKSRKQVRVNKPGKECLVFKHLPLKNDDSCDLANHEWKIIATRLSKAPQSPETLPGNKMEPKLLEEWSDTLQINSHESLLSEKCKSYQNALTSEKTSLLQKDMIEF